MKTEYQLLAEVYGKNAAEIAEWALFAALDPKLANEPWDLTDPSPIEPPLTWPSTIQEVDRLCKGFYGMTVLSAEKGTGKTMMARSSAIEAAASGDWQVVHFIAEDDWDGWRDGFNIYLTQHPDTQSCLPFYHVEQVGRNQTPYSLGMTALHRIDLGLDRPVLIVIDSINSVVNLGTGNYLESIKQWGIWCMLARRLSHGRVSYMITSEANKAGNAKGEGLPYWADVHIKMKKETDGIVALRLDKTRRSGGEGDLGLYKRQVGLGIFSTADEMHNAGPIRLVANAGKYVTPFGLQEE